MLAAAVLEKRRQSLVRSVSTAAPSARHLYILDPGASGMAGVTTLALVVGCNRVFQEAHCQIVIPKHMLIEKNQRVGSRIEIVLHLRVGFAALPLLN